jgi:uncharacterized phiE125 gp8 family phage protein
MIDFRDTTTTFVEPISLEAVKHHLREIGNDNDAMIEGFIRPAREKCEKVTGKSIVAHTFEIYVSDNDGEIELLYPPIVNVTKVEYWDGTEWIELAASDYMVGGVRQKVVLVSSSYKVVKVTYTTIGEGNEDLLRLMKDLIQVWFDNRPDMVDAQSKVINRIATYKIWQAS